MLCADKTKTIHSAVCDDSVAMSVSPSQKFLILIATDRLRGVTPCFVSFSGPRYKAPAAGRALQLVDEKGPLIAHCCSAHTYAALHTHMLLCTHICCSAQTSAALHRHLLLCTHICCSAHTSAALHTHLLFIFSYVYQQRVFSF